MRQYALEYARRGWPVFPCLPGQKEPATTHGFEEATTDEEQIKRWWPEDDPDPCNIGFCPEYVGLFAVDIEREGLDEAEPYPETLEAISASGGAHLIYRGSGPSTVKKLSPHIDTRGVGGYIVLAPSRVDTRDKKAAADPTRCGIYKWSEQREPAPIPEWLIRKLGSFEPGEPRRTPPDRDIDTLERTLRVRALCKVRPPATIGEGSNAATMALINSCLDWCSHEVVLEEMAEHWMPRCLPEGCWDYEWLKQKVFSVKQQPDGSWTGRKDDVGCNETPKYNTETIAEVHRVSGAGVVETPKVKVKLAWGANTKVTKVQWLWHEWLPLGMMSLLAGRPGDGKSQIALSIAAITTIGGWWPDGGDCEAGDVLIWSSEDEWANTILPRFLAAGGDPERFARIDAVEDRPFDPATDMALLDDTLTENPGVKLVILDPVIVLAQAKAGETQNVRRAMQPTLRLIEKHDVALLGITHFAKGTQDLDLLERLIGSQAWGAQARMVWITASNEDTDRLRLIRLKSSIGPKGDGFNYETVAAELDGGIVTRRIEWGNKTTGSARKLFFDIVGSDQGSKLAQAEKFILEQLADKNEIGSSEMEGLAKQMGITSRTLDRARGELKEKGSVNARKVGKEWFVRLSQAGEKYDLASLNGQSQGRQGTS